MNRKTGIYLGIVLLGLIALSACGKAPDNPGGSGSRQYIVGTNPKLEEISGLEIFTGGSVQEQSWSYVLSRSSRGISLRYSYWEQREARMAQETVELSESEWNNIISLLEGEKLIRDKKDSGDVMDGESQTIRLRWNKAPSNYHLEPEVELLQTLIRRLRLAYYNHRPGSDLSGGSLVYFEFYTTGTYINAGVEYEVKDELDWEDHPTGRKLILYKEDGVAYEDAKTALYDEAFGEKLLAILTEHNVSAWDGFAMSDPNVLDGTSFSISIGFEEKEKNISAHGYMSFPPEYREVRDALEELFREAVR